jgi:DNA-sulfur modification-associated
MRASKPGIKGFRTSPKKNASGRVYRGRFTADAVQWTGQGSEGFATFTITADELADAAQGRLLWTDQDVQRGIQPGLVTRPPRELSLSEGYPDHTAYIFDAANADDMVEKLLSGEKLFLSPLVWNLRPGFFEAYWDESSAEIYIYEGKIYLPDSHHRHQAIIKAVEAWRETPTAFIKFSGNREFKIELYFLTKEDEGNYFFDKNQRPKPTAKSKAYDLTTLDDLSLLAKKVIEKSHALRDNVNRVTDRLSAKNPQVVTLSTLREMMKTFARDEHLDTAEMEGMVTVAAKFYDILAEMRPELGHLQIVERKRVRADLVVDAAVMMHGYAALMRQFNDDIATLGIRSAEGKWRSLLHRLVPETKYRFGTWSGDFFAKANPLWQRTGIVKPSRDGRALTVLNTGAARSETGRILRQLLFVGKNQRALGFLANR